MSVMGPPPRPTVEQRAAKEKEEKEKVTDISDISDAMWGSGVDLREEENYLSSMNRSFLGTSFNNGITHNSEASARAFSNLAQNMVGQRFTGSGPISRSPVTMEDVEAEIDQKHRNAALKYAKSHEQHLRDPFLLGNGLRYKMQRIAVDQGVQMDIKGLHDPPRPLGQLGQKPQVTNGIVNTSNAEAALAAIRARSLPEIRQSTLEEGARYADLLSLVSLAANERIRALLDETYAISRGRRYGSHGIVPPDMQDIAARSSNRKDEPLSSSRTDESITKTSWDTIIPSDPSQPSQPFSKITFTSNLSSHLSSLAISDQKAEQARVKRRQERAAKQTSSIPDNPPTSTTDQPSTSVEENDSSTSTPPADSLIKTMSKKEQIRLARSVHQTEEVLHKNSNMTAAMQIGFGKKSKRPSWLSGGNVGSANNVANPAISTGMGGTNPFARQKKSKVEEGDGVKTEPDAGQLGADGGGKDKVKNKDGDGGKFGKWREDGDAGKGIQLRDLVAVLDRDGRCKKTLEKSWLKLDLEGTVGE